MMKRKKRQDYLRPLGIVFTISVFFLAAGLVIHPILAQNPGVNSAKKSPLPAPAVAPEEAAKSDAYEVGRSEIITEVVLTGELKAERSVVINAPDIRSSFSNMVTFLAPEGAEIKKGERIVEFDDSSLESQKSEAERTLDEVELTIEKTRADLEAQRCDLLNSVAQAEANLEVSQLYGKIGKELLPANTYQQYQLNLEKSKLSLQKAQEQLDNFEKTYVSEMALVEINRSQAEINLKKIESDTRLLKVDAPQDGILVYGDNWQSNRKIQVGDTLHHSMEVARLPDLSSMQVVGYVYDTEYGLLSSGMRGTITLDALPDFRMEGVIVSLTNVGSRKDFTSEKKVFQAIVSPDKVTPEMMKPGMTARVRIPVVLAKNIPAVPREYLGVDAEGKYYVVKGTESETASIQHVELGKIGDRLAQIVSGVSVGDPLLPIQYSEEFSK
jgi:multidrug efflux pump subunit AcrA (membrane-fusion protein)